MKRNRLSEEDLQSLVICIDKINSLIKKENFDEETFKEIDYINTELSIMNKRHIIAYMSLLKQGYTPD